MTEAKTERPLALKADHEAATKFAATLVAGRYTRTRGDMVNLARAYLSRAGADREAELRKALEAAAGYMANANIGLAVGTKAQAAKVLDEGQRLIRAALSPQEVK